MDVKGKIIAVFAGAVLVGLLAFTNNKVKSSEQKPLADTTRWPKKFGFGRMASRQEINAWDIDIRPDGKGLPAGQGNSTSGKAIYAGKCLACHGLKEQAGVKLPGPILVSDTTLKSRPKTIGNYWPYATTLFDYIRRAMPYNQPGTLTDAEVYSLTAYLLTANNVIKPDVTLNAKNLPQIVMPAKKLFIFDDRKGGPEIK